MANPANPDAQPAKRVRRRVSGVLLLDKPVGISSNHALQAVKRLFRAEKAGHAGTLDPLASGLLPILLGDATRFSGYLLNAEKGYAAEIRLGATTTTGDAEGEVLVRRPVHVERPGLEATLRGFLGPQSQVPPMYSALKRDGQPLYVLARRGETVERAARNIEIVSLDLEAFEGDRVAISVTCSKGTYIRTLAEDIGEALGCGAHLSALRRTATGAFRIAEAVTLEALGRMDEGGRDALLRPVDLILAQLPPVVLEEAVAARFCHGQAVQLDAVPGGVSRVYGPAARFLGLGEDGGGGRLIPKRLLAERRQDSPTG
ncbi:MAG: tRNA pseudouridine(55) synthase TruB [Proteobacteria bacterium]|nr:tRNA pseudouridine(55) synthase TruB [Pseudomonadota bacterium]